MTKFILLRHGQTNWNIQRLYQGHADIPLNETGKEQAEKAARELESIPFDVIYSSDLQRAKDTAAAVLRYHQPVTVYYDNRIRERNFGDYEGAPYNPELLDPIIGKAKDLNPTTFRFPGGESLVDVETRAKSFYQDVIKQHPVETVLVVSHGSFLSVLSTILYGESLSERKKHIFNNAEPVFVN